MNRFFPVLIAVMVMTVAGCASPKSQAPPPPDPVLQKATTLARAAFERGDIARAADLYEDALVRARAMDEPADIGEQAYNLALCLLALGDYDEARYFLAEARDELALAGQPVADVWLLDAEAARLQGRVDEARTLVDGALSAKSRDGDLVLRVHIHALRALLALDQDDVEAAREEARAIRDLRATGLPTVLRARLEEIIGRIRLADVHPLAAATAFDNEAEYYREAMRYHDMAYALIRSGDAYSEAAAHAFAGDRYFRASRTLFALQDAALALNVLEKAMNAAGQADEPQLERRIILLLEEIEKSLKESPGTASK